MLFYKSEEDIKGIKEVMENAIEDFKVPFKTDVALGRSWGKQKNNCPRCQWHQVNRNLE